MAFVKKTWKDRIVQYANRRLLTKSGGEVEQVTVTRDEGTVSVAGDKFDAATMNDLEQRVKDGFDSLAGDNIPIESGSATNTKDYIDSKATSLVDETGGGGPITAVNGTYQIPASILTHKAIVISLRRYGYFGSLVISKLQMSLGAYGASTRIWGDSTNYWDITISDSGLITLKAINGTAFPFVDCFGIG